MLTVGGDEIWRQRAFEDIDSMHLLIQNPEEFYKLYYHLHTMFAEKGDKDPQSLAMTLMAFPFTGKNELTEDETLEAVNAINFRLTHGIPNMN
jgi:hypothetical protein